MPDYLLEIVGGLASLVFLALIGRHILSRATRSTIDLPRLSRTDSRRLTELLRRGDEVGAAELLFECAQYESAAEFFMRANNPRRAAEALERQGKVGLAIQTYKRAGMRGRAARLAYKARMYQLAAELFAELNQLYDAAEAFQRAGEPLRAAEAYAGCGRYLEAAEIFLKLGKPVEAANAWIDLFEAERQSADDDPAAIKDAREHATKAADLLVAHGDLRRAADLLLRAGLSTEAAELFESMGNTRDAARAYLRAERPQRAVAVFERAGDRRSAAAVRAKVLLKHGDTEGAVRALLAVGETLMAAEILGESGKVRAAAELLKADDELSVAAQYYRRAGEDEQAARAFEAIGQLEEAAISYQRAGLYEKALSNWETVEKPLEMGQCLYRLKRLEEALAVLERVGEEDAQSDYARELEGRILFKTGKAAAAGVQFKKALRDRPASPSTAGLAYKIARASEAAGEVAEAISYYEQLGKLDTPFRDAASRLEKLRSMEGANSASPPPGARALSGAYASLPSFSAAASRYEVLELIARGGMGLVYRARDRVLSRVVAYKVLNEQLKTNPLAVQYFLREARAAASLTHPNIVTVYDAGEQEGEYYMAMEFIEGDTLKHLVRREGPFAEEWLNFLAGETCKGLQYAHEQGLVHRDIKSSNLMLTKGKRLKIMDFGLAKFMEEATDTTKAVGTPYYMSPEQVLGKELDQRSDIYSLGVTMFECGTGKVPFAKGDLSYHHLHTPAPSPRLFNSKLSEEMDQIISKCLNKDPEGRYQDVTELMEVLGTRPG